MAWEREGEKLQKNNYRRTTQDYHIMKKGYIPIGFTSYRRKVQGHINSDIPPKNRYSIFADHIINELDSDFQKMKLQNDNPNAKIAANINPLIQSDNVNYNLEDYTIDIQGSCKINLQNYC